MIRLKSEVIENSTAVASTVMSDEKLIEIVKDELKELFKSDITYKKFTENLYISRAWLGESRRECLSFVLNDRISVYIDENIEAICGDIITGEWLDLDIEECNNILNDIFKILIKRDM